MFSEPRSRLSRRDAFKIRRVVDAALAGIACDLRIGTQWSRADGLIVHHAAGAHGIRSFALFHPVDHGRHWIVTIGADTASAVSHARNHEETEEVLRAGTVFHYSLLVIVHTHHRLKDRVRPAVGHQQLAPALVEFGKIGVLGVG